MDAFTHLIPLLIAYLVAVFVLQAVRRARLRKQAAAARAQAEIAGSQAGQPEPAPYLERVSPEADKAVKPEP